MSRLRDLIDDYRDVIVAALLTAFFAILTTLLVVALVAGLVALMEGDRDPRGPVATTGPIEVYRVGVTTADGQVAECLVTNKGGIHCLDVTEDNR